jgi:hypothetical protein
MNLKICLLSFYLISLNVFQGIAGDSLDVQRILFREYKWLGEHSKLELKLDATINSTGLPAVISNAFVYKKYINATQKTDASSRLNDTKNRLGGAVNAGIQYNWYPNNSWKQSDIIAGISYQYNQFFTLNFSESLFNLAMQGNAPYAGRTVFLNNEQLYNVQYQSLKFHYLKKNGSQNLRVALGLAKGDFHNQISIRQASVFTDLTGAFIDLSLNGKTFSSSASINTIRNGLPSAGPIADLAYGISGGNWSMDLSAENLGFILWGDRSRSYVPDTSIRFSGIVIDNILNFSGDQVFIDSLERNITGSVYEGAEMKILPAQFRASFIWQLSQYTGLRFIVSHLLFPGYQPLKSVSYSFESNLNSRTKWGLQLGLMHGGFGTWNSFIAFVPFHTRNHSLQIGTTANEGWLNPGAWKGNGITFSYQWYL